MPLKLFVILILISVPSRIIQIRLLGDILDCSLLISKISSLSFRMGFSVVIFTEEDGVAIICTSWRLSDTQCYWPPFRSSVRLEKAVLGNQKPEADWSVHAIRVLSNTG